MKLKTYLRGLGIGIIVTTIVMAIALGGRKENLSDEEIVARAKQLGMVESTGKDADDEKKPEDGAGIAESADAGKAETESGKEQPDNAEPQDKTESEADNEAEPQSKTEPQSSAASGEDNGQEPDKPEAGEPKETGDDEAGEENRADDSAGGEVIAGEMVSVSIVNGEDSATVSKRLEELDLVVSATQFDRFLCDNGYAKKLSPGSYEIAIGSSEETIAKIITKSR